MESRGKKTWINFKNKPQPPLKFINHKKIISIMRMEITIMIVGIAMFVTGLITFYSIELGQTDSLLRIIKNTGTFVGLSGMGVTMAGILLYLINRNEAPIAETFEV
jgi:uncharacterized membrane protein